MESEGGPGGSINFDFVVASLRADNEDIDSFLEVLATKFAEALGSRLVVERDKSIFRRRNQRVTSISVQIGDENFVVQKHHERIDCYKRHSVRGIVLSTDEIDLVEWLGALIGVLQSEAKRSAAARAALESLLT